MTGEHDLPGVGAIETADQVERRRLARAIGADEADEFALARRRDRAP